MDFLTLGCNVGYSCYFPNTAPTIETETIGIECPDNTATFKSDRLDMADNSKIGNCLVFPTKANNIKIFFSVCSTVVIRYDTDSETKNRIKELLKIDDDGTNLTLTAARLKELESIIKKKMAASGIQEAMYTLMPITESEQENYYYDPITKTLNRTGTCGPLTNNNNFHESWVTKYKEATKSYVENNIYTGSNEAKKDPHYTWVYADPINTDPKSPDSKMSPGRFNKISATYEIQKQIPAPSQEITFGTPKVWCVGVKAQLKDTKPNRRVSNRNKNNINTKSLTIVPRGNDTPCSR
ncbi:MAG TPA: hypothetical protein PK443_00825 [bacterium]|nr:hypothetical protein [bacterium]